MHCNLMTWVDFILVYKITLHLIEIEYLQFVPNQTVNSLTLPPPHPLMKVPNMTCV